MMTQKEFTKWYWNNCDHKKEDEALLVAIECYCGEMDGPHWAMVENTPESIAIHKELYGKK